MFTVRLVLVLLSISDLSKASNLSGVLESDASLMTERTHETVHTVDVGLKGNSFDPNEIQADVGDIIEFRFFPLNHSVARAPYGYPCTPYENYGKARRGIWSDYKPVNAILPDPPTHRVIVNDTEPIFFYCTHGDSCLGYQMIGVINPNASQTLASQVGFSKDTKIKFAPGEPWPGEFTSTPTSDPSYGIRDPHPVLSAGAIAGITLGGLCILLCAAAIFYVFTRRRANQQASKDSFPPPPSYVDGNHTYLDACGIPAKSVSHEQGNHQSGSYSYPAEADSCYAKSPIMNGNGMVPGMNEIDGTQTFPTRIGSVCSLGLATTHDRHNHLSMSPLEEVMSQSQSMVYPRMQEGHFTNTQSTLHELDVKSNEKQAP